MGKFFKSLLGQEHKKGFTLVEIMLVITIIAILFVVMVPRFGFATDKAKETGVKTDFRAFQTAAESAINEKSFMKLDDGNYNQYLNEYLDKSLYFTDGICEKENPYGYNYRAVLTKNPGDEGSGVLEFVNIRGLGDASTVALADAGDDVNALSAASGSKLVVRVANGTISTEIVEFEGGDSSLVPGDKTPVGIQISEMPKTNFTLGDPFTYAGLKIKVLQADGSYRTSTDYTVTTPEMVVGTHNVTVTFNENNSLTTSYSITIKAASTPGGTGGTGDTGGTGGTQQPQAVTLTGLGLSSTPSKMSYIVGESFNTAGMILTAYYSDGTTATVTGSCSYNPTLTLGQTSIVFTYTYSGVSKTVTLSGLSVTESVQNPGGSDPVQPETKSLSSLSIISYPSKMIYTEGETLDTTGMAIRANYSDGTVETVTNSCVYNSNLLVGQTSVIISYTYDGLTKSVTLSGLSVTAAQTPGTPGVEKTLNSIAVSGSFNLVYGIGDNFNTTGMVVTAVFSDGTTADVTGMITHDGYNLQSSTNAVHIYYTYNGVQKMASVSVQVAKQLVSISVTKLPTKTVDYLVGDTVNTAGMVVTATFSDSSTADVTSYVTLDNHTQLQSGWTSVIVYYKAGETTRQSTFQVYASESGSAVNPGEITLARIEITTKPDKTVYWAGEAFDSTGLTVTAFYTNDTNKPITNYTLSNHQGLTTEGIRTVTATYSEAGSTRTATFEIEVKVKPIIDFESITVVKDPDVTVWYEGQTFDPTGMIIQGNYPAAVGMEPEVISHAEITFSNTKITMDGQYIILKYSCSDGTTLSYLYEIHMGGALSSIEILTMPDKVNYKVGEIFDPEGMTLRAIFEDGEEQTVEPTEWSSTPLKKTDTKTGVMFTHNGIVKSVDVPITVKAQVESIAVTTPQTRTKYRIGGTFDPTGMVVKATYADGSVEDVTKYVEAINGEGLVKTQDTVQLKYTWVNNTVVCYTNITVLDEVNTTVVAGNKTTFFVDMDDNFYAIGLNTSGQLGIGNTTTAQQPTPVKIAHPKEIVPSLTGNFTYFIDGESHLWVVGDNTYGQLGIGSTTNISTPQHVDLGGPIKKVALGTNHALILTDTNHLFACGLNSKGQLGLSDINTNRTTPEQVVGIPDIVDIEAAGDHSFILTESGRVYVMGDNTYGQLGTSNLTTQITPYVLDNTQIGSVSKIYTTTTHTIFETVLGNFYCMGENGNGELMLTDTTDRTTPTYNSYIIADRPVDILLRPNCTMLISPDGKYRVTGLNSTGILLTGNATAVGATVKEITPPNYMEISFGSNHIVYNDGLGEILTYGNSDAYQCALGDTTTRYAWHYPFNAKDAQKIVTGFNQIWIKDSHGQLWTSGANANGQLGNGGKVTTTNLVMENNATLVGLFDNIDYVAETRASANYNTLFVMKDGTLYATGVNTNNSMGRAAVTVPTKLSISGKVKKIVQYDHFLGVLTASNKLYSSSNTNYMNDTSTSVYANLTEFTWATGTYKDFDAFVYKTGSGDMYNGVGNVRTNDTNYVYSGAYSTGNYAYAYYTYWNDRHRTGGQMTNAAEIYSGPGYSFVIDKNNKLWFAGMSPNAVSGLGTSQRTTYTAVTGMTSGVDKIVLAGGVHQAMTTTSYNVAYALKTDGTVYAAGANTYGLTGQNTTSGNTTAFTKIAGLTGVTDIKVGNYYTIFVASDGIYALGKNNKGELGVGTTADVTTLTKVQIDHTKVKRVNPYPDRIVWEMTDGTILLTGDLSQNYSGNTLIKQATVPTGLFQYEMANPYSQ